MQVSLEKEQIIDASTRIIPRLPLGGNCDGDYGIGLWHNDDCLGYAGVAKGLDGYYDNEYFSDLCDMLRDEWVIVQIKRGNKDWKNSDFRNILAKFIVGAAQSEGIPRLYFMSADKNYWMIPKVQGDLADLYHPLPVESVMRRNYDMTAKKNKFVFDPKTGIFVREL